ncbi:MAG TPA: response regulator transcription factor [Nocardioidaceae bacterium]|nr:response regulator transcription factor [Nocardioidaceae bacterium]
MVSVLVVDDEVLFARTLAAGLSDQGFDVAVAHDGPEGYRLGTRRSFDVIVLDIMLPGLSGVEVCRRLREDNVDTPILMLTARGAEADETNALETGADDYLRKPFSFPVLVARCRALLRRGSAAAEWMELTAGDLVLDRRRRVARRGGAEVRLSRRETALLEYLMKSPGRVLSKDEILERVWGGPGHDGNLVEVYVAYLRKKLDLAPGTSAVRTVRGHGYRFQG